ncbi:hypothetical protein NP493_500g02080 [Ridgeia piscesae]|uniref:DNA-directed RNA polymerase n=1 Tax=Ridgeia piscesae TaxID=27915 RepID=A0AAD9KXR5_RIDPI|nr:hypothetical protein NP493_500g02080 [Ridgeia piscesae]
MDAKRVSDVLSLAKMATSYRYDAADELWCEVTFKVPLAERKVDMTSVVEKEAKRTVLYQVPGISRCFLSESRELGQEGTMKLRFEGVNIQEMYNYADILRLNELYTNNIHAMAKTYGIEAACRVIVKEIRDVFMGYGIQVDYHHLSLVADYMTFEGEYKSFSRIGIESNASPLQKMTFETTMHFLKTATIQGACDELKSPSSRLITGRLVGVGTGAFDLVLPANKC